MDERIDVCVLGGWKWIQGKWIRTKLSKDKQKSGWMKEREIKTIGKEQSGGKRMKQSRKRSGSKRGWRGNIKMEDRERERVRAINQKNRDKAKREIDEKRRESKREKD